MRTNTEQGLSWGLAERLLGVCCEICHRRERERENIEIHHLDGNNKNNRRWNLVWIHKACHISLTKANGQYGSWKSKNQEIDASSVGANACVREKSEPLALSTLPLNPHPTPTWSAERSKDIQLGLTRYLWEIAIKEGQSSEQILRDAPGWIALNLKIRPPSDPALRRWLNTFTGSYYPFRLDQYGKIYLDAAEYPTKEGANED